MYIAVDLGGTNTRIASFADLYKPEIVTKPTKRRNTHVYEEDLAYIIETAKSLSANSPIQGLGIGVPGNVTEDKTEMTRSNNLPEWTNRGFCKDLARKLNCPVYMDNDGVAASLGEGYFGNVLRDFDYLIWGTGIGYVRVRRSNDKLSATYARRDHRPLFEAWEQDCGGIGILRKYGKPGEKLTDEEWSAINNLFADYLRRYIAAAKPPAIVFGGGLAIHHAGTITGHAGEMGVDIKITQFGDESGLVGGFALIKRGFVSVQNLLSQG